MNISKYLEMRNLVLIEPETDEFVSISFRARLTPCPEQEGDTPS